METTRRFATWAETQSIDYRRARHLHADQHASIERDVVEEIKRLHATAPKYDYANRPSAAVISANQVEVIDLHATFVKIASGRAQILDGSAICSAEDYVARYFLRLGYDVMPMESRPLHALFAVFMWLLIEDPADECGRIVGFGSRSAFERGERGEIIYTSLPEDFGAPGYGERRATAIAEHLASIPDVRSEWQWTFDYWITGSKRLREYLWAHKPEDLERARLLVDLLPLQALRRILQYLVDSYWARYLGWPDLLVSNSQGEFFFVEVKASADPLSDEQKNWISANTRDLRLPFKIAKIHRDKIVEALTL